MRHVAILAVALIGMSALTAAPAAEAQTIDCQLSGVLVVIALNGPVTVCSVDTSTNNSNDLSLSPQLRLGDNVKGLP